MGKQFYIAGTLLLMTAIIGCSSSENAVSVADEMVQEEAQPDESISLNINEAVYFDFFKKDTTWAGELTVYTLNAEGQKVVQSEYVSANDSTWSDFDLFVDFLNLYQIQPQNEIEGWVPDSGQLPRRVYSFKVFDGDTTRSYSYQDPEKDIREYWQVQNLLTFVTFIQNDLRWVEKEH
ncbi:hypothetical protein [Gracilimonas sp. BCB1]|uniref:hypothetical protein n=1 Tax=Gracilimonas sp. BCB1 TaxID=3152362 RepID=UPI0032D97636